MHSLFSASQFRSTEKNWELHYFEETDSTNQQAKEYILKNPPSSPCVFLAEQQSSGRGRRANSWESEAGKDLLMTAVIETELPLSEVHKVATSVALALANVMQSYKLMPQVKFPNDIYIDGLKVAGILIEQIKGFTLIGIGINVNSTPVLETATSIFSQLDYEISREELLSTILNQLVQKVSLCQHHYQSIIEGIAPLDLFYNRELQYTMDSKVFRGIGKGLSKNGYLLIDHGTGAIEVDSGHDFRLIV
ncbi:biotin--[acetyl-CoA-carboxylase] ligase [Rubritalea spongiae]|uniref:Biotin--[acetyl-CoA-carboxylase] ligase n=1 Tax=Rubritalea spongiae TaxID=430797 RepID=A0ABW5DZH8_9BACT